LLLGVTCLLLAPVGLGVALAPVVWVQADRDLRKMQAGQMAADGRALVQHGRQLGITAVAYAVTVSALACGMLLLNLWGGH
jgi:hypothetical protein